MTSDFRVGDIEQLLETVVKRSGDCFAVIDLEGRVMRWNPACQDMLGWPRAEVLGKVLPHVPEALRRRILADVRSIVAAGQVVRRTLELQRKDGVPVSAQVTVIPLADEDGHMAGAAMMCRDHTVGADPIRKDAVLDEAIADLRSEIVNLSSAARLMLNDEVVADRSRRQRATRLLMDGLGRVEGLADDVAFLSVSESGSLDPEFVLTDPGMLVAGSLERMGDKASSVAVDLDLMSPKVSVAPELMTRAIGHVIETIIDSAGSSARTEVSLFSRDGSAVIEVRCVGACSPSTEVVDIIQRPAGLTPPVVSSPAGVGMYMARRVVHAHGGLLTLARGRGTTVITIVLPPEKAGTGADDE